MGKKNVSCVIDKEIAAGLLNIFFAVVLSLLAFSQQSKIELERRGRKNAPPGKAPQSEGFIGNSSGIGQNRKRPSVIFLVTNKLRRFGERNDDNGNAATAKLRFQGFHLAEVVLAG